MDVTVNKKQIRVREAFEKSSSDVQRMQFFPAEELQWNSHNSDWDLAMASAAIVIASRRTGFGGINAVRFLREVVLELKATNVKERIVENELLTKAPFLKNIQIPCLSPPNTEWPLFLHEVEGTLFADYNRTKRSYDLVECRCQTENVVLTTEEKLNRGAVEIHDMEHILERVPDDSTIHIVAAKRFLASYFDALLFQDFYRQLPNLQNTLMYRLNKIDGRLVEFGNMWNQITSCEAKRLVLFLELE